MNLLNASIDITTLGDNTVIAAQGANVHIRIHRLVLINNVATAQNVTVKDGASTSLTGAIALPSSIGGGVVLGDEPGNVPLWVLSSNTAFIVNLGAATAVRGFVTYSLG